jgi:serine/threonine protein kinase
MLTPGTTLGGRYRLDDRIAGGGMGDVWRATDEVLGRTVAVKVLLAALLEEPGFAERFRGEARTMATINHPGVVDIYDYGNENGTAFLVMEYIEGDALSRTLSRVGRLTPGRTMALIAQAADALHAAHEKGIVHRDVKPGNLLVRPNGTLVLTDFGIARSAMVAQLTAAGSVLGTASYISPEQASGQGATPLSDVYALGIVAYQCLSGRRPFEGDNPLEIAMRHVRDTPPPLPPDIPPQVRQIVETAMAKDPGGRYPSAAAFGHVARRTASMLAAGTTAARPPATGYTGLMPVPPNQPVSGSPASAGSSQAPGSLPPGPLSAGPVSPGPLSAGPVSAGPVSAGPLSAGAVGMGSGPAGYPVSAPPGGPVSGPPGSVSGPPGSVSAPPVSSVSGPPGPPGPGSGASGHPATSGYQPGPVGYQPGPSGGGDYQPGQAGGYQPGGTQSGGRHAGPTGMAPEQSPFGAGAAPFGQPPTGQAPLAAGGTRIMPTGGPSGPSGSGGPPPGGSAAGPGQFARGAAGVPPPPSRGSDTGYTYVGTGPVQPVDPQRPAPMAGGLASPNNRRNLMLFGGVAAGLVVLLLVVVGGYFVVSSMGNNGGNKPRPTTAPTTPTAEAKDIDCKGMPGNTFSSVKRFLEGQGFKVNEVPVDQGGKSGDVVKVPCSAPAGSTVDVEVTTGKGQGGGGGDNASPNPSCGFFGGIAPGRNSCSPAPPR